MANLFLTGSGLPTLAIGEITDYYRDTGTNLIYYRAPAGWEAVPSLIPTPDGVGTTWYHGTGTPNSGLGAVNDYYRDEEDGTVYRKHAVNGWESKGSLDFIGVYGVQWGEGSGAPASTPPLNNLPAGSFYLDIVTSNIYYKDPSLTWSLKGQLGGGGGGGGGSVTIIDNLTSTSTTAALSANQGNALDSRLQTVENAQAGYGDIVTYNASAFDSAGSAAAAQLAAESYAYEVAATAESNAKNYADTLPAPVTVENVLTSTSTTNALSAAQGKVLKDTIDTKADLVGGLVPANQLPSFVDDVLEYADLASFPITGETGKLYVAIDTNLVYRWTGSVYAVTSSSLALGETSNTAYRGDRGKTAYDHSQSTGNPHGTAIADISGLSTALGGKQDALPTQTGSTKFLREDLTWQDAPIPVLTELNFNVQKSGSPAVKIYWDLTALTAQYTHVMPNKPINFGDLPSVATTNGNNNNGTRTTITGGQFNTVTGTDNSVYNSSNNTVSGLRNTVVGGASNTVGGVATCTTNILNNCTSLLLGTTLGNTINNCTFNDISNAYTTPESPLAFNAPQDGVIFTGWVNDGMASITWPKGYTVKGQKRRITGVFGSSISSYYSQLDTVVELAATSTGSVGTLSPHKDLTKRPVTANSDYYTDGYAEHTLTFHGYDPAANQHITGQRVIRERKGVVTVMTPTGVLDTIENGFLLSLTVSVAPQSGYQGLVIQVRNTANSNTCQWQATLVSKLVHVSYVP